MIFVHGSSTPQLAWDFVGIGIRYAQDMGAHRKKVYNAVPSVEEELLKRAFWFVYAPSSYRLQADHVYIRVLVSMDRALSSVLGRPCAIQDEEYVPT